MRKVLNTHSKIRGLLRWGGFLRCCLDGVPVDPIENGPPLIDPGFPELPDGTRKNRGSRLAIIQ